MQTPTPMLTERQFHAGATALLIAAILAMNGVPRTADPTPPLHRLGKLDRDLLRRPAD